MQRFYYYVVPSGNSWAVRWDKDDRLFPFQSKDQAVAAAVSAARANWDQSRLHSGVKIQLADGRGEEGRRVGNDPEPPLR